MPAGYYGGLQKLQLDWEKVRTSAAADRAAYVKKSLIASSRAERGRLLHATSLFSEAMEINGL